MSTKISCILAVAGILFCFVLCLIFCIFKHKISRLREEQDLHSTEIDGNQPSTRSYFQKWCSFWCADDLTYDVELDSGEHHDDATTTDGTELKAATRTISSRSSHSGRPGQRSNRSNSIISSIEIAVTNIKESPKLTRNSTSVARRLSHDPFLLCHDLQTIEMRKFQQKRRMSEQLNPSPYRPVDPLRSKTSLYNY